MGGLLSAYDLLTDPFSFLVQDDVTVDNLLVQAKNLAEILSAAFTDGNALPSGELTPDTHLGDGLNSIAGAGTLVRGRLDLLCE